MAVARGRRIRMVRTAMMMAVMWLPWSCEQDRQLNV